jgi:hypothetical protein
MTMVMARLGKSCAEACMAVAASSMARPVRMKRIGMEVSFFIDAAV